MGVPPGFDPPARRTGVDRRLDRINQLDAGALARLDGLDPIGAGPISRALEGHPVIRSGRPIPAVVPVFGDGADPVLAGVSAAALTRGLTSLLETNTLDPAHIDALVHTSFAADDYSRTLRDILAGGGITDFLGDRDPTQIPALPPRLAEGCLNGIRGALGRLGSQVQATREAVEWARLHPPTVTTAEFTALTPARGCPGGQVVLTGPGFGPEDPLVSVYFTGANGGPLRARVEPGGWSDASITVTVPDGVATGPVGLVHFQGGGPQGGDPLGATLDVIAEVDTCLGAAGAMFGRTLERAATGVFAGLPGLPPIPGSPGDPNWFVGGRPIVHAFTIDSGAGPGPEASIASGAAFTLRWDVENADSVVIVPTRSPAGDRTQLPIPSGVLDPVSGSWSSGAIAVDWAWAGGYELQATNACSIGRPTTAEVTVSATPAKPSFLWGVALAAAQYEGGLQNDWSAWTSRTNSVEQMAKIAEMGEPSTLLHPVPVGVAMRHEDPMSAGQEIGRAHTMRMGAYRFSLDWSRIEPVQGQLDTQVLDQLYLPMLRTMRAAGLEPVVTLHHLSNPLWVLNPPERRVTFPTSSMVEDGPFLASLRGWESVATVDAFVSFVSRVVSYLTTRLGPDAPTWWITMNEPIGSIGGSGYAAGIWPPGFTANGPKLKVAYENLVRAHVRARNAIKAIQPASKVGVAQNIAVAMASPDGFSVGDNQGAATQTEYFYAWHSLDAWHFGTYDLDFERRPGARHNVASVGQFFGIAPGDWQPTMDFVGVNYYRSWWVYQTSVVQTIAAMGFSGGVPMSCLPAAEETAHLNDLQWRIDPGAFLRVLRRIRDSYGLPVLVTENGMADAEDRQRPSYTTAHADVVRRARAEGVDVQGYLHWSVTDNWEWHMTYQPEARFGLYRVDRDAVDAAGRQTLPRRPTESALAMACLSAGLPADVAVTRFGSYSDDGGTIVAPTASACRVWSGSTPDGTTWTLLLADLSNARMLGWLRDSATTRWVALDELAGAPSTGVSGAHRRGWGVPERELSLAPSGGDLTGTIRVLGSTAAPASQPVTLTLDPFVGTWLTGEWPFVLLPFGDWERGRWDDPAPAAAASTYVGRWLTPNHPRLDGDWAVVHPGVRTGNQLAVQFGAVATTTLSPTAAGLEGTLVDLRVFIPGFRPGRPTRPNLGGHPQLASVLDSGPVLWTRAPDGLG
jgi:beta-glucosidase